MVDSGRATPAPTALGSPSPMVWNAVPTITSRSGEGTRR